MKSKDIKKDMIREQPLSYDDYAALDDGNRYELVNGVLELMSPAPTVNHQIISFQIQKRLADSCGEEFIILNAPIDVILSRTEVRQPDLVSIHRSRMNIVSKRGIEGPPDLVVEILSPSTAKRDKLDKLKTYATYRISEYWIVDPANVTLEQYVLMEERFELTNIYSGNDPVRSERISCVTFTMEEILSHIPESLNN